jgi:L-cysteine S-thiosulfotransferase
MLRVAQLLPVVALLAGTVACEGGRHSPAGFRLPANGDVERGKVAFLQLGCSQCHEVSGMDFPKPTVQPPVPVVLGGVVPSEPTDGYLVSSIINPSYVLAPYPKEMISVGGKSRMPDYNDKITVQQLVDTVAFLQSRYKVQRPPARPAYF